MKKRYGKFCFSMAALAVLLAGCVGEPSAKKTVQTQESADQGSGSGIVFEGRDMEGNSISNEVFSGVKLTMVNVWATYCNPCLSEMPGLGELAGAYDPEKFQIIGIISDVPEDADEKVIETAAALIETTGANYTHLLLSDALYFTLLKDVTAVPTTFFIDENGEVVDTVIGAMEKSEWEEKIDGLLEE